MSKEKEELSHLRELWLDYLQNSIIHDSDLDSILLNSLGEEYYNEEWIDEEFIDDDDKSYYDLNRRGTK